MCCMPQGLENALCSLSIDGKKAAGSENGATVARQTTESEPAEAVFRVCTGQLLSGTHKPADKACVPLPAPQIVYRSEDDTLVITKGELIADRYKVHRLIDEGTFCVALKCSDICTGTTVCVKVCSRMLGQDASRQVLRGSSRQCLFV
jgi:hypothetical protein